MQKGNKSLQMMVKTDGFPESRPSDDSIHLFEGPDQHLKRNNLFPVITTCCRSNEGDKTYSLLSVVDSLLEEVSIDWIVQNVKTNYNM